MKILCVIDCLGAGGAQRQIVEMAIGFKEKGHDVSFLTYHNIAFYNPILVKEGIQINCIEENNYFVRLLRMRKFIRNGRYDSVLSFLEAATFICEVAGFPFRKWRLIVGERNSDPSIKKNFRLKLYRWVHFLADYIVANSYSNINIVRSVNPLLSSSKCKVIYNCIDLKIWKPANNFSYRTNGKLKLVIAASHIYRKNLNGLIDALALLDNIYLDKIEINWYGDHLTEPYYDSSLIKAKEKISALKLDEVIKFYPASDEIAKFIKDADIIGLFSFNEGLPNIVCEGMACGKPIICSSISDLPVLLSYDLNLLCNPYEPESIKRALIYIIDSSNDHLAQIGSKNHDIARLLFDKDIIVNEYLKLLSQ